MIIDQSQERDMITHKIAWQKPKILSVLLFSTHVHMLTTAQMCPRGQKPVPQQVTALPRWKQKPPLKSKNSNQKEKHPDKKCGLLRSLIVEHIFVVQADSGLGSSHSDKRWYFLSELFLKIMNNGIMVIIMTMILMLIAEMVMIIPIYSNFFHDC